MWLRLHVDIVNNPKIQRLPDRLFRFLVNCWCLYKQNGCLPLDDELAWRLRCSVSTVSKMREQLVSERLLVTIDGVLQPNDWNEHQYQSDVSTARVKKFREKLRGVSRNVSTQFHETPPETEQRQSRDRADVSAIDAETLFETLYARHPKKTNRILAEQALAGILASAANPEAVAATIEAAHENRCFSAAWFDAKGKYAPQLHRWLTDGGYLDAPEPPPDPSTLSPQDKVTARMARWEAEIVAEEREEAARAARNASPSNADGHTSRPPEICGVDGQPVRLKSLSDKTHKQPREGNC